MKNFIFFLFFPTIINAQCKLDHENPNAATKCYFADISPEVNNGKLKKPLTITISKLQMVRGSFYFISVNLRRQMNESYFKLKDNFIITLENDSIISLKSEAPSPMVTVGPPIEVSSGGEESSLLFPLKSEDIDLLCKNNIKQFSVNTTVEPKIFEINKHWRIPLTNAFNCIKDKSW